MRTGKNFVLYILELIGLPFFYLLKFILIRLFSILNLIGKNLLYLIKEIKKLFKLIKLSYTKTFLKKVSTYSRFTIKTADVFKRKIYEKLSEKSEKLIIGIDFAKLNKISTHFKKFGNYLLLKFNKTSHIYAFLIGLLLIISFYNIILKDLPSPKKLVERDQIVSTKIYDRNKELLYKIYKNENRSLISINELPLYLIQATISIEDKDFFDHTGISLKGIVRAIKRNIVNQKIEGGSTITQQLVKNALLTPEKTLKRKVKEMILAIRVELAFEKEQILQMYFNEVGYGGAAYGIEEASQLYFGKSASDVSLAEAAVLAGLPAAPTTYSPFGANPELAIVRQHQVLRRMVEDGYISAIEAEKAKTEKIKLAQRKIDIVAPHFVMYVKDLLVKKYGEQLVNQGGLEVITSLDLATQKIAEKSINKELEQIKGLNITNAASLVTNPKTGEILAMVGSKDYFDFENDGQVNVTLRPRQPGSAIKVINYAVALSNGFTPATIIDDSPIVYRVPGSPAYSPRNYDGIFHGKVTLRKALANSYNVPAVKTLSHFGVVKMIELGQKMGISTWNDKSRFGLSLTLGSGEVKMIDMMVVYGSLANEGVRVDLNPILYVSDYKNNAYQSFSCGDSKIGFFSQTQAQASEVIGCEGERVLDPLVSYQITDILADNNARASAFGRSSALNIDNHHVAVKTGTTNNLRDNWTIGYTKNLLVATWVGNNDNSSMSYVASGLTGASPIWNSIMTNLLVDKTSNTFSIPNNLSKVSICQLTGTLSCSACPNNKIEYFLPRTEPKYACNDEMIKSITEVKSEAKNTNSANRLNTGEGQFNILEGASISR